MSINPYGIQFCKCGHGWICHTVAVTLDGEEREICAPGCECEGFEKDLRLHRLMAQLDKENGIDVSW